MPWSRCKRFTPAALIAAVFFGVATLIGGGLGLFNRYPFDDEVYALELVQRMSLGDIAVAFSSGYDIHPPISFLLYKLLATMGLSDAAMRLVSFQLSVAAVLVTFLTVRQWLPAGGYRRTLAAGCFLMAPLLYGVGDSLRWYPILALLIAVFVRWYILDGRPSPRAALVLGLAGSTAVAAFVPYVAMLLHRFWLRRARPGKDDVIFHAILLVTTAPAVLNLLARNGVHRVIAKFGGHGLQQLAKAALGIGGGCRLGPSDGLAALPYWLAVLGAALLVAGHDRRAGPATKENDFAGLTAMMVVVSVVVVVGGGLSLPRSFLFLAPPLAGLVAIAIGRAQAPWVPAAFLALHLAGFAALAVLFHNDHPFKRNMEIPFEQVEQALRRWKQGRTQLMTNENVTAYLGMPIVDCVSPRIGFRLNDCGRDGESFDTVIVIGDGNFGGPSWARQQARLAQNFNQVQQLDIGIDRDAELKARLTGVELPSALLRMWVYRRR